MRYGRDENTEKNATGAVGTDKRTYTASRRAMYVLYGKGLYQRYY
jgi:hypothetical protein